MAGQRQTLDVLLANGKKHMTKAEIAERRAQEIANPEPVDRLKPPKWLASEHRREFKRVADQLVKLMPTMVCETDADIIAAYCMARAAWLEAAGLSAAAMADGDLKTAEGWTGIQSKAFSQARSCAADLGLTISARCRMVVPDAPPKAEDNPILKMLEGGAKHA